MPASSEALPTMIQFTSPITALVPMVAMAVVIAYLCYASMLTTQARKEQSVTEVVISFDKGSEKHRFATVDKIRKQIAQGGFKVKGNNIDRTDVVGIAKLIAKNSYVKDVDVYTTCTGRLYVDIEQHTPVLHHWANERPHHRL